MSGLPRRGRLRVAVVNPLHGRPAAETGLEARILLAGHRLGWVAGACPTAADVEAFDPDLVLSLHPFAPKQTEHVWYGCMWHPPGFLDETPTMERQAVTQDGFLVASDAVRSWLHRALGHGASMRMVGEIQTSVNCGPYRPVDASTPRLVYSGVHWDGPRHRELFERLDEMEWMDIYGPRDAWTYLRHSYRGVIPFDGVSIIETTRLAGAGLCLHHDMHRRAGTPSLRLFEIVAASAVVVAQRHPFIEEHFGDAVLFLDDDLDPVEEIGRCMRWIAEHREEARRLTVRAHRVLTERFTLERMLARLPSGHHRFLSAAAGT